MAHTPVLASVLRSPSKLGIYAFSHTPATVLTPVLILNGSAAILREGVCDSQTQRFLF